MAQPMMTVRIIRIPSKTKKPQDMPLTCRRCLPCSVFIRMPLDRHWYSLKQSPRCIACFVFIILYNGAVVSVFPS